jgi:hypothetical protein
MKEQSDPKSPNPAATGLQTLIKEVQGLREKFKGKS